MDVDCVIELVSFNKQLTDSINTTGKTSTPCLRNSQFFERVPMSRSLTVLFNFESRSGPRHRGRILGL